MANLNDYPRDKEGGRRRRRRRLPLRIPLRFLVPNLVTVLAICAGLSGIRMAFEGRFEIAVTLVLVAALLDAVDGRIARMLKASSNFGAQMDSLADIVNFGAAPALVLFCYVLDGAGSIGWVGALIFTIACALRLARFNVMLEDPDRPAWQGDYFVGVPAPAGAVIVLLPVYLGFLGIPHGFGFALAATFYTVVIAVLMVSRVPVYSGKSSGMRVRRDLMVPLIMATVFYAAMLFSYTWLTLTASVLAALAFLPYSARRYATRKAREEAAVTTAAR